MEERTKAALGRLVEEIVLLTGCTFMQAYYTLMDYLGDLGNVEMARLERADRDYQHGKC